MFAAPVRGIRIYPWDWYNWICLRIELYGFYVGSGLCSSAGQTPQTSQLCTGDRDCGKNAECRKMNGRSTTKIGNKDYSIHLELLLWLNTDDRKCHIQYCVRVRVCNPQVFWGSFVGDPHSYPEAVLYEDMCLVYICKVMTWKRGNIKDSPTIWQLYLQNTGSWRMSAQVHDVYKASVQNGVGYEQSNGSLTLSIPSS